MKKFSKIYAWLGSAVATFAIMIGTFSANSACILYLYQPKVPKEISRLKK